MPRQLGQCALRRLLMQLSPIVRLPQSQVHICLSVSHLANQRKSGEPASGTLSRETFLGDLKNAALLTLSRLNLKILWCLGTVFLLIAI